MQAVRKTGANTAPITTLGNPFMRRITSPYRLFAVESGRTRGVRYLFAPTSRPETNCFWKAKNTIAGGMAPMSAAAASRFHELA